MPLLLLYIVDCAQHVNKYRRHGRKPHQQHTTHHSTASSHFSARAAAEMWCACVLCIAYSACHAYISHLIGHSSTAAYTAFSSCKRSSAPPASRVIFGYSVILVQKHNLICVHSGGTAARHTQNTGDWALGDDDANTR